MSYQAMGRGSAYQFRNSVAVDLFEGGSASNSPFGSDSFFDIFTEAPGAGYFDPFLPQGVIAPRVGPAGGGPPPAAGAPAGGGGPPAGGGGPPAGGAGGGGKAAIMQSGRGKMLIIFPESKLRGLSGLARGGRARKTRRARSDSIF